MLVLFETAAGYALFKVSDKAKLSDPDALAKSFSTPEGASKLVKLHAFSKFDNMADALAAASAIVESKLHGDLKSFLKKKVKDSSETLALSDAKVAKAVKAKLGFDCIADEGVPELMRGIRSQLEHLLPLGGDDAAASLGTMQLGLAHSMGRYKLKFSPDKVDTMIVHAIALLDDLDKELNTYAMRVREWYGWHFPEMGKIVTDNVAYAKLVRAMGVRTNCTETDMSELFADDVAEEVREAAVISMGTEVSEEDIAHIQELCDQVIALAAYRAQLSDYLKNRMMAIAPNLTVLVGELVGARLIAHAGSLLNLAKHPASTIQILGAEKALFRALKTKHDTPKYGLIYHASLIGQTPVKQRGKISRMLAGKCALSIRVDALSEDKDVPAVGTDHRERIEAQIRALESGRTGGISRRTQTPLKKIESKSKAPSYSDAADVELPKKEKKEKKEKRESSKDKDKESSSKKRKRDTDADDDADDEPPRKEKKSKKSSKSADDDDADAKKEKKHSKEKREKKHKK